MFKTISEIFGYLLFTGFALGWLNLGQGPEYTWWGLIYYLGSM